MTRITNKEGALCITNAPPILSGSDRHQHLGFDAVVHKPTDRFAAFDNLAQRSYEVSNIVQGVIIGAVTLKGQSSGVVVDSDCFDCGAVRDSELHDQKSKESVWSFGVFRALPFPLHLRGTYNGPNFNCKVLSITHPKATCRAER